MSKHRWMWKINKSVKTLFSPSNQNMSRNFNGRSIFMYGLFNITPSNDRQNFVIRDTIIEGTYLFQNQMGLEHN